MPVPTQPAVQIDTAAIPSFRREDLARGALDLMEQVFSMPGAEEQYQEWLKARNAKKAARAARRKE